MKNNHKIKSRNFGAKILLLASILTFDLKKPININVKFLLLFVVFQLSCNNGKINQKSNLESKEPQKEFSESIWDKIDKKSEWFINDSKVYFSPDSISPEFIEFYEEFISNSEFQIEHIKFPINAAISKCDTTIILDNNNWRFDEEDLRDDFYNDLDSNIIYQSKKKLLFKNIRKEIGLLFQIGFEKQDGKWYMTLYYVNVC